MVLQAENHALAKIRFAFAQARHHIHATRPQHRQIGIAAILAIPQDNVAAAQ
jgi:hypothetical protein